MFRKSNKRKKLTAKKPTSSAKHSYLRRIKRSMCKKRNYNTCRKLRGCKWFKSKRKGKKGFCRKQHNKKRNKSNRSTRKMKGGSKHLWEHRSVPASL